MHKVSKIYLNINYLFKNKYIIIKNFILFTFYDKNLGNSKNLDRVVKSLG